MKINRLISADISGLKWGLEDTVNIGFYKLSLSALGRDLKITLAIESADVDYEVEKINRLILRKPQLIHFRFIIKT